MCQFLVLGTLQLIPDCLRVYNIFFPSSRFKVSPNSSPSRHHRYDASYFPPHIPRYCLQSVKLVYRSLWYRKMTIQGFNSRSRSAVKHIFCFLQRFAVSVTLLTMPMTSATGNLAPSSGLHTYTHRCACTCAHTHVFMQCTCTYTHINIKFKEMVIFILLHLDPVFLLCGWWAAYKMVKLES